MENETPHDAPGAVSPVPPPRNEPVRAYAPGAPEKAALKARLDSMASERIEIPLVIGGREVRTGDTAEAVMPFRHRQALADWHRAGPGQVGEAIDAALEARRDWARRPWEERAAVFLKAAELLAGPWRDTLNAATMLGQAKTVHQSEIDAACELIDFLRFNVHFAREIHAEQPLSAPGVWNRADHRGLEGFVYAVTPFNFTAIAGNLAAAPALMGNTVVWKPSPSAMLSAHWTMKLFEAAGLPPGVVNLVPGDAGTVTDAVLASPHLAGIHFTGSTAVFRGLWRKAAERIDSYRGYPRLVGETGGKDFIVAHASADPAALATAIVRGGFEYQGQKCSAVSRVYLPASLRDEVCERAVAMMREIRMGDPRDFRNFMSAVIHREAFARIRDAVEEARRSARILQGGGCDDSEGYFVEPTLAEVEDPGHRLLSEEVFGPLVAVHVYADDKWEECLALVDRTSPYGLTGAVFATERKAVAEASAALREAAGNFYINDKPTGAVVGQQPFGGARASGTNDKAGSKANLLRWTSPRVLKETFVPDTHFSYPFMGEE